MYVWMMGNIGSEKVPKNSFFDLDIIRRLSLKHLRYPIILEVNIQYSIAVKLF